MPEYKVNIGPYQADVAGSDYRVNIGPCQADTSEVLLSGTGSISLAGTGNLTLPYRLISGSTAIIFAGSGPLWVPIVSIYGSTQISFVPTGHLVVFKFIAGTTAITLIGSGDVVIIIEISGTAAVSLQGSGGLSSLFEYFTPVGGKIKFGVWKLVTEPDLRLTRDDLFIEGDTPPVHVSKRNPDETFNRVTVRWTDVDKESGFSTVIVNDEVDQRITGIVRKRNYDLLGFTTAERATKLAYRLLAESMYRYTSYKFTLSYKNMLIETGKVVSLSDGFNLVDQWMRVTKITESKDGSKLEIEAVEDKDYLYLLPGQSYSDNKHIRPTPPTLTEPHVYLTESLTEPRINFHICPQDVYFNGFIVFYSFDNASYSYAGRCNAEPTTCNLDGSLLTSLQAWPAVIHTRDENLHLGQNATFADLQPATDSQFFNNLSLMKIEDEVVAFRDVSGIPSDFLVSNLIRGLFNTVAAQHSVSAVWNTLKVDFEFTYNQEDIGKTVYFKVLPFYGKSMIQLEDATPVSYTIKGSYRKPCPASITRLVGREGLRTYMTDDVDVRINLGSKEQGFNIGGFDVALYGAYSRDPQIITVETRIWNQAHTVLAYTTVDTIDLSTVAEFTKTITNAMKGGYDPVIVSLTPGGLVKADEKEITLDRV